MNVAPSLSQMIWVEAEHFADYGGWTCDSQFMDQMGSPYLLAVGMGVPVTDAVTFVEPAAPGLYRLWVRSRDWFPGHGPGPFQVLVNGRAGGETPFGISGEDGWRWENGGVCDLSEKTELRLRDRSGYYGRCDVIALCADLTWVPPATGDGIAALRERFGGVSDSIKESGAFDVIVAGGGLAGCTAAVAAARGGARTLLLQNRSVLGGNASTEILVPPVGSWPHGHQDQFDPHETGLIEEIRTEGLQRTEEARFYAARLHRWVTSEPNLTLFLSTHITTVETAETAETADGAGHINAVVTQEVPSGQRRRFSGLVFVDCTGDAAVGVAAGAEYRHGREPRSLYNESLAPLVADATTMGNSLKYFSLPTGTRQPFVSPSWVMSFPTCASFPFRRHPVEPAQGSTGSGCWNWAGHATPTQTRKRSGTTFCA